MAVNKDKNSYTMVFAVIMVLVVGTLLAGFSSGLKPMIKAVSYTHLTLPTSYAV